MIALSLRFGATIYCGIESIASLSGGGNFYVFLSRGARSTHWKSDDLFQLISKNGTWEKFDNYRPLGNFISLLDKTGVSPLWVSIMNLMIMSGYDVSGLLLHSFRYATDMWTSIRTTCSASANKASCSIGHAMVQRWLSWIVSGAFIVFTLSRVSLPSGEITLRTCVFGQYYALSYCRQQQVEGRGSNLCSVMSIYPHASKGRRGFAHLH